MNVIAIRRAVATSAGAAAALALIATGSVAVVCLVWLFGRRVGWGYVATGAAGLLAGAFLATYGRSVSHLMRSEVETIEAVIVLVVSAALVPFPAFFLPFDAWGWPLMALVPTAFTWWITSRDDSP